MHARTNCLVSGFCEIADPKKAPAMAAYMKTGQPFYGIQAPARRRVVRSTLIRFPIGNEEQLAAAVLEIWNLPHREDQYAALDVARANIRLLSPSSLPLLESFIRQGAWWDVVDEIATHLIGPLILKAPASLWPLLDAWISDPSLWIRRTALLAQNRLKALTREDKLFSYCLRCASEKEFFIRKAIGWALREFAYSAPQQVKHFLVSHSATFSPLSIREASKHLPLLLAPTPQSALGDENR